MMSQSVSVPLQTLTHPVFRQRGIEVKVLRDDLYRLPPWSEEVRQHLAGNKWHKLRYNADQARREGHTTLLAFGGAYSNLIRAVATLGQAEGFRTIGVIRGEPHEPLNPVLQWACQCGMTLHYVDRTHYRQKHEPAFRDALAQQFGRFYLIPEGGSNALAVRGCRDILASVEEPYDWVCCPCGTGGTLAGLVVGMRPEAQALGFSVLKGGDFLRDDVRQLLHAYARQFGPVSDRSWDVCTAYHFGGYARTTAELTSFVSHFTSVHRIPLEPIYTGKMFYGIVALAEKGFFPRGSALVAVHTGGVF
ncbi:1-aminocyclopropane-1-carboxylate deaminase [Catalinimonas alkaloidigena]|uniref:1-aminocyclopropane-1-carboxylate deaminase n=1 Tax=Catalinimonas alkaloidigena TaxID=1075417 RepID=A0A1G9E0D7_9BACT|nr:pyridoxal-phosphate dependent enzyme [Catalinimonas alkaloidigena]SDK69586.1 1-aminocyclopropane-1-carboxylate deaminase [Catalinimonas alkaloidigena]